MKIAIIGKGRYINVDKLLTDELMHTLPSGCGRSSGRVVVFADDIENAPTADVVEVRHGSWIHSVKVIDEKHSYHRFRCSLCNRVAARAFEEDIKDLPYCHCGAKMDGERREE